MSTQYVGNTQNKSILTSSIEKVERENAAPVGITTEESKSIIDTGVKKVVKEARKIVKKVIPNKNWKKFKWSVYTALIFFLLSAPQVYIAINKLFGGLIKICEPSGAPSLTGLILQSILFCWIIYFIMTLNR
jgi:uncharacterized membrane protein YeiB